MENKRELSTNMIDSDETDSCCVINRFQNDSGSLIKPAKNADQHIPTVVTVQKLSPQLPPTKMVQVKPVVSSVSPSNNNSNKPRIDKIVDNLKINLLQQQNKSPPPKVSLVNVKPVVPAVVETSIQKEKEEKEIITSIKQSDEDEDMTDLTNLNWLNSFSLNIKPLSPPESPQFDQDEADGGHMILNKNRSILETAKIDEIKPQTPPPRQKLTTNNNTINTTSSQVSISENLVKLIGILNKNPAYLSSPKRPPYSFSFLTFMAIESSERKRLSVKEIYSWVIDNFPYYRNVPSGSWKNSIRSNLSFNQSFAKVDKNLLAMRDFSGKGSLWCVNPNIRPLIQEALTKTQNYEQIPYLKDVVTESPKTTTSNNNNNNNNSQTINQPTTVTLNRSLINNCNNILQANKTNKKRFSIENAKPAILNPKLINRVKPTITQVINRSSSTLSIDSNSNSNQQNSDECCTEMDAVNALLSMKARSSSMPVNFNKSNDNSHLNNLESSNRGGRRKQVFKTPIKRKLSQEVVIEKPSNTSDEDDSYNSYDLDVSEDEFMEDDDFEEEMEMYKNNRKQANSNKKLLVKFPLFTKPLTNKSNMLQTSSQKNNYSESEEENEDDYEPKSLKIDEDIDAVNQHLNEEETNSTHSSSNLSTTSSKSKNNNALFELSRAASLIIESQDQKSNESDQQTMNDNKNVKKHKPNEEINQNQPSTRSKTQHNSIITRSKTSDNKSSSNKKTNQ